MRTRYAIVFGSMAALAILATPARARNAENQKATNEQTASSPTACHSYQQEADGSWKELPCRELGSGDESRHKPSSPNPDDGER